MIVALKCAGLVGRFPTVAHTEGSVIEVGVGGVVVMLV